ncbi:MAG: DUF3343 domain-containing protein [Candidatus Obscuribacterales bacterium]|nr:DUF3343 domain-containing protein [Candidatus Obscuribacterales bacterium]
MTRILLTYESLHQLLKAESRLQKEKNAGFRVRPTPTPPQLSDSVCGMALEILVLEQKEAILEFLGSSNLDPSGIHLLDD